MLVIFFSHGTFKSAMVLFVVYNLLLYTTMNIVANLITNQPFFVYIRKTRSRNELAKNNSI